MLIRYTKASIYRCNEMRLIPGVNEVKDEVWKGVEDHPLVKSRVDSGEIILMQKNANSSQKADGPKGEKPKAHALADLNAKDANVIVKQTLDIKLLKAWQEKEERKVVLTALEKQIDSLDLEEDDKE